MFSTVLVFAVLFAALFAALCAALFAALFAARCVAAPWGLPGGLGLSSPYQRRTCCGGGLMRLLTDCLLAVPSRIHRAMGLNSTIGLQ